MPTPLNASYFQPWDGQLRDRLLSLLTPMFVHRLCSEIRKLFMIDTTNNRFLIRNQLKVFRGQVVFSGIVQLAISINR